jgi:hypothetical protein
VSDKSPRVAGFHHNTLHALAELLGAAGLEHPQDLKPWHLQVRHQSGAIMRGDDVYPRVAPGALLNGEVGPALSREWERAQTGSFDPVLVPEAALTQSAEPLGGV